MYLTEAEQEEIRQMEELFGTTGWKTFIERNQTAMDLVQKQAIHAKNSDELFMLKGQMHVLQQVVQYEQTFLQSVEDTQEERKLEAALGKEEEEESSFAAFV